jgi:hypothetical protein
MNKLGTMSTEMSLSLLQRTAQLLMSSGEIFRESCLQAMYYSFVTPQIRERITSAIQVSSRDFLLLGTSSEDVVDQWEQKGSTTLCPLTVPFFRFIIAAVFAPYFSLHFPRFPGPIARCVPVRAIEFRTAAETRFHPLL